MKYKKSELNNFELKVQEKGVFKNGNDKFNIKQTKLNYNKTKLSVEMNLGKYSNKLY